MWQKCKPFFIEAFGILNPGVPFSSHCDFVTL